MSGSHNYTQGFPETVPEASRPLAMVLGRKRRDTRGASQPNTPTTLVHLHLTPRQDAESWARLHGAMRRRPTVQTSRAPLPM